MAERRMFSKSIVLSDAFLDMPLSARCLYFTLGMMADDDGFVGSPKAIMRQCGASQDDMSVLLQKRYVLGFQSGVIVIKHWRMNNYLRNDRYHTTTYLEEKEALQIDERGAYTEKPQYKGITEDGIPNGDKRYTEYGDTEVRLGKDRLDKVSKGKDSTGNNIPPLPPSGEFDKHNNIVNYQYLKETIQDEYINYIRNHTELDDVVETWMRYKDEKKPKASNHYSETGMGSLLKKIYKMSIEHGIPAVTDAIESSMGNNYQGIVWDRMPKQPGKVDLYDIWMNA